MEEGTSEKNYLKEYGVIECSICGKNFIKTKCNQLYCSKECKRKRNNELHVEYARRRYAGDPEFRERQRSYRKKYYQKRKENAEEDA